MNNLESLDLSPTQFYRRRVDGADFSLEANTREVPDRGRFYVLRRGCAVFSSRKFQDALSSYHDLCQEFWEERLDADDEEKRLSAAWGLVGLDPTHSDASTVIRRDGDSADERRLEGLRRRHYAQKRKAQMDETRAARRREKALQKVR